MQGRLLETCERVLGEEHSLTLDVMDSWAGTIWDGKRRLDAMYGDVLRGRPPETIRAMYNMEDAIWEGDILERVEALCRRCLDIRQRTLGPEHPSTFISMWNLAMTLSNGGELDEAEGLVRQCLEIRLRAFDEKFGDKEPPPVTSPWEAESTEAKVLAYDDFDGKLALDWNIRNPDPSHHSLTKTPGMLTITTQNGDFWNTFTDYKNLFLIDCPASDGEDFQVTTCLSSFNPVERWHQAGLILYNDDDEYLKFTYECGPILLVGFETGSPRFESTYFRAHPNLDRLWLRVTKRGNRYTFSTSLDGKRFIDERWSWDLISDLSRGFEWGDGSVKQVGLLAMNGVDSKAPEIDASFDFFEVRSVPGKTDAPEEETLAAAAEREELGSTLWTLSDLGKPLIEKGELEKAESILKECLETQRRVFGKENRYTVRSLLGLSWVLDKEDKLDEMEKVVREVVEIRRRVQGEHHADTLMAMDNLASLLIHEGKHAEAEQVCREALEVRRRSLGEDHPETLTPMPNVARALGDMRSSALRLRQTGNFDEAEATFGRLLQTRLRVQGPEAPDTLIAMKDVATTLFMAGNPDEAEATLRQAVTTSRSQEKGQSVTPELMMYLARLLEARGKQEEAELLRKESMEIRRRLRGEEAGDKETSPGAAEAQGKSVIPTNFLKIPEEMEACAENLQKIYAAIKQYEKDKGKLPAWLSDLVTAYLSNDTLLCPKDPAQTSPYYPDPEIACSYTYEFSPAAVPEGWDPTGRTLCCDWKPAQVRLFGEFVPVLRCHHHGTACLNLSVGGEIYWSPETWEGLFLPNYLAGDELSAQRAPEQGGEIATSGDQ